MGFLGPSSCFPSLAKVKLGNGKSLKMSELKIGDQVQTSMHIMSLISMQFNIFSLLTISLLIN